MNNATEMILKQITKQITKLSEKKSILLIGIDGRCASGKTTIAASLQKQLNCQVIHMDEFFLRPEQRTPQRLEEIGGNIDYERFEKEVMQPIKQGISFSYRPFDCRKQVLLESIKVKQSSVYIIEGSYSCHPKFWNCYDLHIFMTTDLDMQIQRISDRNGQEALEVFRNKWIPLEEKYFAYYNLKANCDICIKT